AGTSRHGNELNKGTGSAIPARRPAPGRSPATAPAVAYDAHPAVSGHPPAPLQSSGCRLVGQSVLRAECGAMSNPARGRRGRAGAGAALLVFRVLWSCVQRPARPTGRGPCPVLPSALGDQLADELRQRRAVMGVTMAFLLVMML